MRTINRLAPAVLLVAVLAACSDDPDTEVEVGVDEKTPTASASPTLSPRPETTEQAAKLQVSELGSSVAKTAEEKAVVKVWMTYWEGVTDTYADLEPSPKLDVARGKALSGVLDYVNELKAKKQRSVGWTRDHVTKIAIDGDSAAIRDCAENFSFAVDADGTAVEEPTPYYDIVGSLKKSGDSWQVTVAESTSTNEDCRK